MRQASYHVRRNPHCNFFKKTLEVDFEASFSSQNFKQGDGEIDKESGSSGYGLFK